MSGKPTDEGTSAWLYAEPVPKPASDSRLVGKWQMFVPPGRIDEAWEAIARRIQAGELGISGKVSTGGFRPHAKDDAHVIIVYAADWRDLDNLRHMLRVIRGEGFAARIYFKRDAETLAGEYATPFDLGDGGQAGTAFPRPNRRKVVSVWGSPEADVIATKWVDEKVWTVVTDSNVVEVLSIIAEQDASRAAHGGVQLAAEALGGDELAVPPSGANGVLAAPDDYYVDVLDAADAWYELVERDDEPTATEWDSAHDALGSAIEALRGFEATAGTGVRDEPWGGKRAEMVDVVDAADAWYFAYQDDDSEGAADAVLDRLGDAVQILRARG